MLKKLGNPVADVNGVFEIYENNGKYDLYQKTYIGNNLTRIPLMFMVDDHEICLRRCQEILDAYWDKMLSQIGGNIGKKKEPSGDSANYNPSTEKGDTNDHSRT